MQRERVAQFKMKRKYWTLFKRTRIIVVNIKSDSLEHLLATLATAKVVVSVEGSHATHCAYSVPENSGLIVLQPPDRFLSFHQRLDQIRGREVWICGRSIR